MKQKQRQRKAKKRRKKIRKKKGKNDKKNTIAEETVDDKHIMELKEKLDKINEDIYELNKNKNINNDKKIKYNNF